MKKKKIVRFAALLLVVLLIVGIVGSSLYFSDRGKAVSLPVQTYALKEAAALTGTGDNYRMVAENDVYTLNLKPSNGNFYIENKKTKTRWYANPENASKDTYAVNIYKMELASSLIVTMYDRENKVTVKKNSETACVRNSTMKLYTVPNGFRADYDFEDEGITIPVEITLEKEYLNVRIVTDEIKEETPDKYIIRSVKLLPNFGAAGTQDKGYVLLPDGCGALMDFNDGKSMMQEYSGNIYGSDLSSTQLIEPNNRETVELPVFGIKKNDSAFIAVITGGDTSAVLNAIPNLKNSSYGEGYAEYILHSEDAYMLDYQSTTAQTIRLYQTQKMETPLCEQRYYFLEGEDADYNGMAKCYQSYLLGQKTDSRQSDGQNALFLDFYGAVKKKESVAGIPVNQTKTLSTLSEIEAYYKTLEQQLKGGVSMRLLSWSGDYLAGKLDGRGNLVGGIGSWKDYAGLSDILKKNGEVLSLGMDMTRFSKSGNGINSYADATKALSNSPAYQYQFLAGTRMWDTSAARGYILSSDRLSYVTGKILKSLSGRDVQSVSPYTIANNIYGSYGNAVITKEQTKTAYIDTLKRLSQSYSLVLDCPAGYAVGYAGRIVNVPTSSSGYDVFDEDVPFYQLVVSGICPYTTADINLESDANEQLLKALETGSELKYAVITGDSRTVIDTKLNNLYSADASVWQKAISKAAATAETAIQVTQGSELIRHDTLAADVTCSTFQNGAKILVNFGDTDYISPYGVVKVKSYLLKGSEK